MDLDALRARLGADPDLPLAQLHSVWRGGDLPEDAEEEDFLVWLLQRGHIAPRAYLRAQAVAEVHTLERGATWVEGGGEAEAAPAPEAESGPRFRPLAPVGAGGMSSIWLASDAELGRKVAYKVLTPEAEARPALFTRFLTEVQVTAQLDHPNIVPIYALERENGRPRAYAMKLVHGETLGERAARSARARAAGEVVPPELSLDALLEAFLKVCDAIAHAHAKGVVHRDLKPANIMVGRQGEVYVMDWGLAKVLHEAGRADATRLDLRAASLADAQLTRVGAVLGTPAYMAPEQARGETGRVGPAADVYALGLVLFELVCGRPARDAAQVDAILLAAAEGVLPPISGPRGEALPRELDAILRRALAADPEGRYPSVAALADDLRRFRANEPVLAAPDGVLQAAQRWLSRHRQATSLLMLGLLAALGLTAAGGLAWSSQQAAAAHARETWLTGALADTHGLAADIDLHFAAVEAQVVAVAAASRALLAQGAPSDDPWYASDGGFAGKGEPPPDLAWSPVYRAQMSTAWPDVSVVAGADRAEVDALLRRLHPIRHEQRRAHLALRQRASADPTDEAAAERAWREEPGPMRWLSVATAQGALVEMPGIAWDPTGFDPRVRPWYTLGVGARAPRWGHPYQEAGQPNLSMTCAVGLFDAAGVQLGVVTASTGFDWLLGRYLRRPGEGVVERLLVDAEGRVLIRSTESAELPAGSEGLGEVHGSAVYERAEVLAARAVLPDGHLASEQGFVVWRALHIPGWSLVVELQSAQ